MQQATAPNTKTALNFIVMTHVDDTASYLRFAISTLYARIRRTCARGDRPRPGGQSACPLRAHQRAIPGP
ncbi:protein of unknown function (plasmid) [Pararobbsia alpina]